MKTIFTAIILVFSISIFAQREEPKTAAQSKSSSTTGSNYFNDDPFFKINFIKTPSKEANDIETAVGMIKMVSYMVEEPTVAYMVAYSTYPSSSVNASSAQVMLDNAIGGFIGNLGMTIISQKEISLQGHKGIFFKYAKR
ncbi:MAG: hypothetical protein B6I20_14370 [Bacteroidetes bacterium 4572_117]|nr:MAG: hypothetical protein B6I20_14370 [Bacteroidetes bacterium 4572_117]